MQIYKRSFFLYCKNCGKELDDKAYICVHCGVKVKEEKDDETNKEKFNVFALVGLISAFFIPLLGWIFGGIGLSRANKSGNDPKGRAMSIAAITVATVVTLLTIIYYILRFVYLMNVLGR